MSQMFFESFLLYYFHVLTENGLNTTVAYCPSAPEYDHLTYLDERSQV
jgi:hypothetical protein